MTSPASPNVPEPLPSPLPRALEDKEAQQAWRTGSGRLSRRGSFIEPVDETGRGEGVSTLDYMISLMGYAIGIGNVWRFPYLVGRWGGFSFLIAYVLCLCLVSCPMYLFELALGQDTRKSTIHAFRAVKPRWAGLGWCTCVMLFFVLGYYNMLLAYSIVYMYYSFYDPLPWTAAARPPNLLPAGKTPSEYFWQSEVLARFDPDDFKAGNTSGTGGVLGHLAGSLFIVWILVFLALFKGLEASAKVSYVTVGLPVVLILVMLCRALTLDGAGDGIEFYVGKFDGSVFGDPEMWTIACGQILFSLSPGMGTAVTLSSYTRPKEDVYKVNLLVSLCNSCFSITGGFVVFSILGFMSHTSCNTPGMVCQKVADLAGSGMGLAFVTLAEGVAQFGGASNVFALFLFFMLLTLGLDSTFAWVETFNTYINDMIAGGVHKDKWYAQREFITAVSSTVLFLTGLPYCTPFGGYLLDQIDHFVSSYILIIVCFIELLMLRFDWGWDLIEDGLRHATKGNPGFPNGRFIPKYWGFVLTWVTPPVLMFLFFWLWINDLIDVYEGYPGWMQAIGWIALILCIAPFFIVFMKDFSLPGDPHVGARGRKGRSHANFDSFKGISEPLLDDVARGPPGGAQEMAEVKKSAPGQAQSLPQSAAQPVSAYNPPAASREAPPAQNASTMESARPKSSCPLQPVTQRESAQPQVAHVSHFIGGDPAV
eukprot:Hpha_TRINITY_DN15305_c3_g2::TRINITY_DN15305_c3_g2_i1::g.90512::m.90512/K05038/SLC6A5S; solute carrier family 6 (neurotransmitter transporter, amino acid) member 5/7/9/14